MKERREENRRHESAGFTLVEILLVVTIIGMLATLAAVNIPKYLNTGKEGKAKADVSTISTAIEMYNMTESKYPSSLSALSEGVNPYMKRLPKDPWRREYQYSASSSHQGLDFEVYSFGKDGQQSADDIGNWEKQE